MKAKWGKVILIVVLGIVVAVIIYWQNLGHPTHSNAPSLVTQIERQQTDEKHKVAGISKLEATTPSSLALDKTRQLILELRAEAMKTGDVQALCLENASLLEQLRQLGADAIPVYLDEIADKNSPASLRMLLIESVAHLSSRDDDRFGPTLMAIITDFTDDKNVKMRALLWIPEIGSQPDGAKLLEMLPKQTDADLEFGIVRALRGFKVSGSVNVLAGELSDEKSHLIRIAAYHALAKQGDEAALNLLQKSVAQRLANGCKESQAEENAVAVHSILALGELPNTSSLTLLESVAMNQANSVSVRSIAYDSIAAINGVDAQQVLRRALKNETDESVLVYIARALSLQGDASDVKACMEKAATVSDSYTKNELQRAARTLQQNKGNKL